MESETVEVSIEFIERLILVLRDADERLGDIGTNEIIYCRQQLKEKISSYVTIDTGEDLT